MNNIEWSHAGIPPGIAEREDVLRDGAEMDDDEIAVWIGSDGANVLYGTHEQLRAFANQLLLLLEPCAPCRDGEHGSVEDGRCTCCGAEVTEP